MNEGTLTLRPEILNLLGKFAKSNLPGHLFTTKHPPHGFPVQSVHSKAEKAVENRVYWHENRENVQEIVDYISESSTYTGVHCY